jgi:hypothetical protein
LIFGTFYAANVFAATTTLNNNAPTGTIGGTNTSVLVMNFSLIVGADSTLGGQTPSAGTATVDGVDANWTTVYYYDAEGAGVWNGVTDALFVNDGNIYYDATKDTSTAGIVVENTGPGTLTEPVGWNLFFRDAADGGVFNSGADWIGTDNDADEVYTSAADTLVDADGTATTGAGSTALTAGTALFDIANSDLIVADNTVTPAKVWRDVINNAKYTGAESAGAVVGGNGDIGTTLENLTNAKVTISSGVANQYDAGEGVYVSTDNTLSSGDTFVKGETIQTLTNAKVTTGGTGNVKDAGEGVYVSADTIYGVGDTLIVGSTLQALTAGKVSGANGVWAGDTSEGVWDDVGSVSGYVDDTDVQITTETLSFSGATTTIDVTSLTGIAIGDTLTIATTAITSGAVSAVSGNTITIVSTDYSTDAFNILQSITRASQAAVTTTQNLSTQTVNAATAVLDDVTGIAIGDTLRVSTTAAETNYWQGTVSAVTVGTNTITWTATQTGTFVAQAGNVISIQYNADVSSKTSTALQALTNAKVTGSNGVYAAGEGVYVSADTILDGADTIVKGETLETLTNAMVTASGTGANVYNAGEGVFISADTTFDSGETIIIGTTLQALTYGKVTIYGSADNVYTSGSEAVYDDVNTSLSNVVGAGDYRLTSISAEVAVLGSPADNTAGTNVGDTAGWVKQNNTLWVVGDDIFIENFAGELTYSAAADAKIAGLDPSAGSAITTDKDSDWTTLYFYDAASDSGAWAIGSDAIWIDNGVVYCDVGKDTSIAGITVENTVGTAAAGAAPAAWLLDSIDSVNSGAWNAAADSIVIDADDNDFYLDQLNAITVGINSAANITSSEITNVKFWLDAGAAGFQGTGTDTLIGTAVTANADAIPDGYDADASKWYISGKTQNLPSGTSRIFVSTDLNNAANGKTIKFEVQTVSGTGSFNLGETGIFLASTIVGGITNANFQTVDAQKPTISAIAVNDALLSEGDIGVDKLVVTIDFSETMGTGAAPTVTFYPTLGTTLTNGAGVWTDGNTYTYSCDVVDVDVEQTNVHINVSGAKDLVGNTMLSDTTTGVDKFSVDTIKPTFVKAWQYDTDGNGNIDEIAIEMSESILDSSITFGNFALSSGTVDSLGVNGAGTANTKDPDSANDKYFTLEVTVTGTAVVTTGYTAGTLTDAASNSAATNAAITSDDQARPVLLTGDGTTKTSGNGAGKTSTMALKYSESVTGSSTTGSDYVVELSGTATAITVSTVGIATNTITLNLDTSDLDQTTGPLQVTYTGARVWDSSTNYAVAMTDQAITDGAAPIAMSAAYKDLNGNGKVDVVDVTLSEDITVTTFKVADWTVPTAGTINLVKGGSAVDADLTEVSAGVIRWKDADAETNFNGNADITGGSTAPKITYAKGAGSLRDAAANELVNFSNMNVTDGASPVISTAKYKDINSDGTADRVDVTWTESISGSSAFESGDWSFPTNPHTLIVSSGTLSTTDVRIVVTGAPVNTTTLSTTTVKYWNNATTGSITDGTNAAVTSTAAITLTDSAPPELWYAMFDADYNGNQYTYVDVYFSEAVANASIATTDFSISTAGVTVSSFYNDADTSLVTLKLSSKLAGNGPTVSVVGAIQDTAANTLSSDGPLTINTYRIALNAGWNMFSIPADVSTIGISTVLASIWSNINMSRNILCYNASGNAWKYYSPQSGTGTLTAIEPGKAYWVHMTASDTLIGNYDTVLHGTNPAPIIELTGHRWNMIGQWATYNQTASTSGGLASLSDVLATSGEILYKYTPSGGFVNVYASPTVKMQPGDGFWLYLKTASTGYYTLSEN